MCLLTLLPYSGCSSLHLKNYGRIIPDRDATIAFEKYQMNTDFNYYISGSDVYPNAFIGLDKSYTLDSDLWKKVEMTPAKFREIVQYMQSKAFTTSQPQHGFAMFDDKGNKIGIWYSILSAKTTLQMKDERTVIIYTPDIDTYLKYEDDSGHHNIR